MNEKIIEYISNHLVYEELDEKLDVEDDLLESGLIDSLGIMKLVVFIENEFQITVPPEDMTIENFMTVGRIGAYVTSRNQSQ